MPVPAPWTDQQIADQLTRVGRHWDSMTIEYSFNDLTTAGNTLDANNIVWINRAIDLIEEYSGFTFNQVASGGDITFNGSSGNGTYASSSWYTGSLHMVSSNIFFDQSWTSNQSANLSYGSYGFTTILHEFLHSLGLSHPGAYDAGEGVPIEYLNDAEFEQDTRRYSIMSYFDSYEDGSGSIHFRNINGTDTFIYAQTPMVYDLLAMSSGSFNGAYGGYAQNATTRNTDTTYGYNATSGINEVFDFSTNTGPVLTIYDTGGEDTLDLSGDTVGNTYTVQYNADGSVAGYASVTRTSTVIDLREGAYSSTHGMVDNIGIAFGTQIENAIGTSFMDTIHGNDLGNKLEGRVGNDTLFGYGGNDILQGGVGSDTMTGGSGKDVFFFSSTDFTTTLTDYITDFSNAESDMGVGTNLDLDLDEYSFSTNGNNVTFTATIASIVYNIQLTNYLTTNAGNLVLDFYDFNVLSGLDHLLAIGTIDFGTFTYGGAVNAAWFSGYEYLRFDIGNTASWNSQENTYSAAGQWMTNLTEFDAGHFNSTMYDYDSSNSWTSITDVLNAASQKTSSTTYWDDARFSTTFFDFDSSQTWVTYVDEYNASSQKTTTTTTADDATYTTRFYDFASNQSWTDYIDYYSAAAVLKQKVISNDDSSSSVQFFDWESNQVWTNYVDYYGTNSNLSLKVITNDDGSSSSRFEDWNSTQAWTWYQDYYDTSSNLQQKVIQYDDGSSSNRFEDYASNQTWTDYTDYYGTNSVLSQKVINYDDGSNSNQFYDWNSTQAWSDYTDYYSTLGVLAQKVINNDDGTEFRTLYDHDSSQGWSTFLTWLNASDQTTQTRANWDDTSYQDIFYDVDNLFAWNTHTINYDTGGNFVDEVYA